MSKVVNATPETQLMPSPNQQKTSHCKVSLVALGAILIIGGAVAAGMLYFYSQLGSLSFCSLATIPFGIAFIVAGIRCGSGDSTVKPKSQTVTPRQPLPDPVKQPINTQDPEPTVGTQEWVDKTFPLGTKSEESKVKLQALIEVDLKAFGHLLKDEHFMLLKPNQLNWLPWAIMLKREGDERRFTHVLSPSLFSLTPQGNLNLRQLNKDVMDLIYHILTLEQLSVLTNSQVAQLPWKKIITDSIALKHCKPLLLNVGPNRYTLLQQSPHWKILEPLVTQRASPITAEPEKQPEPPKPADKVEIKTETVAPVVKAEPQKQPESPPVGTQEWVNLTYPLGSAHSQETKVKLQALGKDELSSYGHLLGPIRLEKLKPTQFNWLPWETFLKTNLGDMKRLIKFTFEGSGTSTQNLDAFLALEQPVIEKIWECFGTNQLAALSPSQCTWLPWNTWEERDIKYFLNLIYPDDKPSTRAKLLLLKDTQHWNAVTPYLGQKQLDLLK